MKSTRKALVLIGLGSVLALLLALPACLDPGGTMGETGTHYFDDRTGDHIFGSESIDTTCLVPDRVAHPVIPIATTQQSNTAGHEKSLTVRALRRSHIMVCIFYLMSDQRVGRLRFGFLKDRARIFLVLIPMSDSCRSRPTMPNALISFSMHS